MIRKELIFFIISGLITTLIDLIVYIFFLMILPGEYTIAKGLSFVSGTISSYFFNKSITFGHKKINNHGFYRYVSVYLIALIINVSVNSSFIYILREFSYRVEMSYIVAVALSASFNFLALKFFVFHQK